MSKKDVKGIARESFDRAIAECMELDGLKDTLIVSDKAAFTQIMGKKSGHRIYVSKAKVVKQVDYSGFGAELIGTRAPSKPNGKVEAQLNIDAPDAMERFMSSMVALAALEPTPKAPRKREASADKEPARTMDSSEEAAAKRKALILRVAAEKGVKVSPRSIAAEAPVCIPSDDDGGIDGAL